MLDMWTGYGWICLDLVPSQQLWTIYTRYLTITRQMEAQPRVAEPGLVDAVVFLHLSMGTSSMFTRDMVGSPCPFLWSGGQKWSKPMDSVRSRPRQFETMKISMESVKGRNCETDRSMFESQPFILSFRRLERTAAAMGCVFHGFYCDLASGPILSSHSPTSQWLTYQRIGEKFLFITRGRWSTSCKPHFLWRIDTSAELRLLKSMHVYTHVYQTYH